MDLTKIEKPFGLLDEATQKALRECGGPWEIVSKNGWVECTYPRWIGIYTYRQKPQPPKPREYWIRYSDESVVPYVRDHAGSFQRNGYIHVREVIE